MMAYRFLLWDDGWQKHILTNAIDKGFASNICYTTNFHQIGDKDKSESFLEDVKKRFMKKHGCSEAEYRNEFVFCGSVSSRFELKSKCRFSVELELGGSPLKILRDIFPDKSVEVRVKFRDANVEFSWLTEEGRTFAGENMSTKSMQVVNTLNHVGDDDIEIPKSWYHYILGGSFGSYHFVAKISIEVSISDFETTTATTITGQDSPENSILNITKTILEEGVHSDVTIIAGNGSEFKCHKSFLAVRSPVLAAMFRSECKEATEHKIEVKDMTENGVRSFLAYLYYGDLSQAGDCHTAFELFEAGHKYEVASLKENVSLIFVEQPIRWFDVRIALNLFTLYGHLEGLGDLRKKTLQVMKEKYDELVECEDYDKLFATDPQGAKNLCKHAFRHPF